MSRKNAVHVAKGLRFIATVFMMLAVYRETGIWTTTALGALVLSVEAQVYGANKGGDA